MFARFRAPASKEIEDLKSENRRYKAAYALLMDMYKIAEKELNEKNKEIERLQYLLSLKN